MRRKMGRKEVKEEVATICPRTFIAGTFIAGKWLMFLEPVTYCRKCLPSGKTTV
jgi:hypothetical protein